jgi:4-hydroxy-tetrahydrodipicolinate reductase
MGLELMCAVDTTPDMVVYSAIDKIGLTAKNEIGEDPTKRFNKFCPVTDNLLEGAADCDVIIDFAGAAGTYSNLQTYKVLKKPLVIGSTGFEEEQLRQISALQANMPLLISSNMSMGVNILLKSIEITAKALGEEFDIEIFEAHHKYKVDAPSGTAITMGEAAARGRGKQLSDLAVYERYGHTGERKSGKIGFQVMRGSDIAGEHTVFFCGAGERIELTHRATNRSIFANGAVRCAKWLVGKPNGLYSMNNVLGI